MLYLNKFAIIANQTLIFKKISICAAHCFFCLIACKIYFTEEQLAMKNFSFIFFFFFYSRYFSPWYDRLSQVQSRCCPPCRGTPPCAQPRVCRTPARATRLSKRLSREMDLAFDDMNC
jgi:hypothetical protein